MAALETLEASTENVTIVRGHISEEYFKKLLFDTDIAVMAYTDFGSFRTSSILLDAIHAGCLPIVLSRTWMSDVVERFGCGVSVSSLKISHILKAIKVLQTNPASFYANLLETSQTLYRENSWDRLATEIHNIALVPYRSFSHEEKFSLSELSLINDFFVLKK